MAPTATSHASQQAPVVDNRPVAVVQGKLADAISAQAFIRVREWDTHIAYEQKATVLDALENGQIIFLPKLKFHLNEEERSLLTPQYSDCKSKNISFNRKTGDLKGATGSPQVLRLLKAMVERFSSQATTFIKALSPSYANCLILGRASYRPLEIQGRKTSLRKDDTRLHVDAFPANPNQGKRILRLFCNLNPNAQDRVWRVGEPLAAVVKRFLPEINKPFPGSARILQYLKITKSYRIHYDYITLQLHDRMKRDDAYQQKCQATEIRFPAGSSWIVQTDHVSHAALSGQYLLEQTFYLPVTAMSQPDKSPLRILESLKHCSLI